MWPGQGLLDRATGSRELLQKTARYETTISN